MRIIPRSITYCDYYQVGKGRDMGVDSVLGFFMKLASGTARMTSSRQVSPCCFLLPSLSIACLRLASSPHVSAWQAYRLAERTSLTRNLSFYYAHVGMYIGSLHEYHNAYLMLALGFIGCIGEATSVLQGAAAPSLNLINELYGWMALLFFGFHLLPYVTALLREEGWVAALCKPIKQLLQLSPVYFSMQGRMIGHCFAREFSEGGGGYVATGRGLSVEHIPFYKLYTMMAIPGYYPAVEMIFFLLTILFLPGSDGEAKLNLFGTVFAWIYPVSLLFGNRYRLSHPCLAASLHPGSCCFCLLAPCTASLRCSHSHRVAAGPSWFNPHAFEDPEKDRGCRSWRLTQARRDFHLWVRWLTSTMRACDVDPNSKSDSPLDQLSRPLAFYKSDVDTRIELYPKVEGGEEVTKVKVEVKNDGVCLVEGGNMRFPMTERKVKWGVVVPDLWPEQNQEPSPPLFSAAAAGKSPLRPSISTGTPTATPAKEKKYTRKNAANPRYADPLPKPVLNLYDNPRKLVGKIKSVDERFKGWVVVNVVVQDGQGQRTIEQRFENPWNGKLGKLDAYQTGSSWREFHASKQQNKSGVEVR